jgi:hypothetical protein
MTLVFIFAYIILTLLMERRKGRQAGGMSIVSLDIIYTPVCMELSFKLIELIHVHHVAWSVLAISREYSLVGCFGRCTVLCMYQ